MRKFYLMMLAGLCGLAAQAIELTFWIGNQKITPGETIEFNDVTVTDMETYKEVTMKPSLYLSTNIYSSSLTVKATCTSGQTIQMCAGGRCQGGVSVTKEKVTVQTGQKFPLEFDYIGELDLDEPVPTVTTLLEAEDTTEPGSKIAFTIVMSEKGASLSRVEAADGLTAVAGGIAYDVEGNALLSVYSADGLEAFSAKVSGSGTVNLPAGLYIATLDGKTTKILVK